MLSHKKLWAAIDKMAEEEGYSPSGLAKKAGLDSTSFNKSKRIGADGKLRWPSTESLYKVLKTLNKDLSYLSSIIEPNSFSNIPVIGHINNFSSVFSDNIKENNLESIAFPRSFDKNTVAFKIKGAHLEPLYPNGSILIVSTQPDTIINGDRVMIQTKDNNLLLKEFIEQKNNQIKLKDLSIDAQTIKIPSSNIRWMGRIMWASQ